MAKTDTNKLTAAEIKQCVALGASISEVRALANDGMSFDEILDIYTTQAETRAAQRDADHSAQATIQAQAQKKALRPENEIAPGISVFSNPRGDRDDPKPPFKCKMFWCGTVQQIETCTPTEVALLNDLEPGEYICSRTDGVPMKVKVRAVKNEVTEKVEELHVDFNHKGLNKHNLFSMSHMLTEMAEQRPSQIALVS